jgi:hypothetical protein
MSSNAERFHCMHVIGNSIASSLIGLEMVNTSYLRIKPVLDPTVLEHKSQIHNSGVTKITVMGNDGTPDHVYVIDGHSTNEANMKWLPQSVLYSAFRHATNQVEKNTFDILVKLFEQWYKFQMCDVFEASAEAPNLIDTNYSALKRKRDDSSTESELPLYV